MSEEIERDCLTLCHAVSASERVVAVEINQFKPIFASDPISVYENCLHPFLEIDAVNSDVLLQSHKQMVVYIPTTIMPRLASDPSPDDVFHAPHLSFCFQANQ